MLHGRDHNLINVVCQDKIPLSIFCSRGTPPRAWVYQTPSRHGVMSNLSLFSSVDSRCISRNRSLEKLADEISSPSRVVLMQRDCALSRQSSRNDRIDRFQIWDLPWLLVNWTRLGPVTSYTIALTWPVKIILWNMYFYYYCFYHDYIISLPKNSKSKYFKVRIIMFKNKLPKILRYE